jgi:N-acetylmuramoyl-L-alanine amidase
MLLKGQNADADNVLMALEKASPSLFQVVYDTSNEHNIEVRIDDLVKHLKASIFEFESLKPVCLAQWMLESGRGTSELFRKHCNAGGLKWRPEMTAVATPIEYNASDGIGTYCHFNSLSDWIRGYWTFIDRAPYRGWRKAAESSPRAYISFIASRGYAEDDQYVAKILKLLPEAELLLGLNTPNKIKILIDPGHSEQEPGARSIDKSAEEEDLNRLQAEIIVDLISSKYECEVFDPSIDNLASIGEHAKGKKIFLSLHHNSYDGQRDPGTEIFITRGDDVSRDLAEAILNSICLAINSENRGVKEKNYTVIAEASNFCEGPVMLIESYFLNPYSREQAIQRSSKAAHAIAEALLSFPS